MFILCNKLFRIRNCGNKSSFFLSDDEFEHIPTKQKDPKAEAHEEKKQATSDSFDFDDDGVVEVSG